ncbi:bifunctional ATP-dependent DNA helicase/ssDNA endodeoxyribonuclease DNA2 [Aspergillus luchuensis]|uniref:DNA replication ATP-dependent helicase/nuclease n=1 Tax=Aspergillus kawachii TaxID=1069201 RepID=A0A7R7WT51_ASPKA|nr:tripartite DNA replication factor [Aspergillus luchuensis]BCR95882.1 tripartite DNA replication factor [Aspergillus luchuensis]BCS08415.1 tripartite DNA replication factor [Aspergillus luchuensis]GAA83650.1 DNA replication helicase Dna2 [Aspergillus luchuensis IFO 4308]
MNTGNGSHRVSSQSRSKLNAFRYNQQIRPTPDKPPQKTSLAPGHANKENQTSWLNGVTEPEKSNENDQNQTAEAAEPKAPRECPHTPGNRIPLADLINNAEDAFIHAPMPEFTPEDYVVWQHVPASSNPDRMSQTPAHGKKRRHSSSPTSSPLAGTSKSRRKGSLDLQNSQTLQKTPQHDLAADLWNSYVSKTLANGNGEILRPRFTNLLPSSPQTPASVRTSRDSSSLRRSNSCMAEWPSSKAKRRRIDKENFGTGRSIFSRTRSNVVNSGNYQGPKISSLVEEIEKTLKKAPVPLPDTTDSSPIPARNQGRRSRSKSPTEDRKSQAQASKKTSQVQEPRIIHAAPEDRKPLEESSSDYGDDEFDQDFFDLAEASIDPFVDVGSSHLKDKALSDGLAKNGASTEACASTKEWRETGAVTMKTNVDKPTNNVDTLDADEFDDDFDGLSDGMEDLLAQCEKSQSTDMAKPVSTGPAASRQPIPGAKSGYYPNAMSEVPIQKKGEQDASFGDEFDDDGLDIEAIEQSMMHSGADASNDNVRSRQAIKRYLIVDIAESAYKTLKGRVQPEQVLSVQDERTKEKKVVILRESWCECPCVKESYIHLIGDFDATGHCIVDDSRNMVILHPDHLVSATVVADSISCQRRAVLQDRIKYTSDLGKAQVFGNIFHEVFQEAIKLNKWDTNSLRTLIEGVTVKRIEDLYLIRMTIPEAVEYIMSRIPGVQAWAERFLRVKPSAESLVEDRGSSKMSLSINKLLEVEEHIWSPMYGLKGNVDATVQVACHDGESDKNLVIPLELKTGNRDTNQAHRAQTALYTLLLSDRYDVECTFGLLYYLETTKIFRIRGIRHELLQMIQQRNRIVGYMRQRTHLPPMAKKSSFCNKCYSKTPCFIYHKLADDGDGETSGLGDDFVNAMDHLTSDDRDFFRKWDDLLTKEEKNMIRFKRELWTMLSSEREALGRCFGNVVIDPSSSYEDKDGPKINRYRYTFVKKQPHSSFSFTESQLTLGEPIVVSDEKGHFALANGYVVQVSRRHITVAVDRRLHNARTKARGFDAERNQSFKGIMEILEDGASPSPAESDEEPVYRLDKDEFSNGMAIVRTNLVSMMERDLFQARQLRRLIVKREAPAFKTTASAYTLSESDKAALNVDQRQAIDKVMRAEDYALVLGMPGTGKTTTIAHIIRALVAQGKSVLLTSYTHTAVDNILLKIKDDNFRILRIGAPAKVHPDVQQFADLAAVPKTTLEELKASYEDSQVVATTCLGVSHGIFSQRMFDYCIVDEASQITLPVCLGPIRMARTFILVGDHYQLPPLVQNKEAQEGGLDVSLFKLLSDSHPASVVNLEHQYRMCEDIMLLSNTLIYSGRLKCGTGDVAVRSLNIPNIGGLKQHHPSTFPQPHSQRQVCLGTSQGRCWLKDLVEPSAKTRLVNTDTLSIPALDVANGSRIVNPTEATICSRLVEAFISSGIPARSIGVIALYRSQLSLLKQNLSRYLPDLEMHTADKFQGRDKEVIILSCVRSNADKNVGDLLRDWRRVNVAFTRARTKLLVVGSKSTLRDGNELLGKYVKLVQERGWIYDLPRDAMTDHIFESEMVPSQSCLDKSTPSPKKSKSPVSAKKTTRSPFGPVQTRLSPTGLKKPAKRGAKLMSGGRVLGNRPILQDMVNDLIG